MISCQNVCVTLTKNKQIYYFLIVQKKLAIERANKEKQWEGPVD